MKPKTPNPRLNRQILEEASDWFVDFRVGDVDSAARERFDEWLRRSPEHIRAYWEVAKTYVNLPSLTDWAKLDIGALIAYAHSDGNVVPLNVGLPANELRATTESASRTGRAIQSLSSRRRFLAAAACTLLATLAIALWWSAERFPQYATDVGERRSLTLADGSTVDLNARSKIRIQFTRGERRVELLEGQALFQVAKDKDRPFIVRSGDATVRAVGTQFDVYRKSSGTTVTVLEGRVAVYAMLDGSHDSGAATPGPLSADTPTRSSRSASSPLAASRHESTPRAGGPSGAAPALLPAAIGLSDPDGGAPVFLSAGEQVTVTPAAIPIPQHADLTAATAWMQRRLTIDGAKLSDVVAEFNRYNHRQLVIEGKELSDFHVSGVYSSTDPTSLLRFLREQSDIRIIETDTEVRITRQ
jgi:transmembrane sensor